MREPNDVTPCEVAEIERWDDTADVIVVGFGAAGSTAAFSAAEAGAEVLVTERTGGPGGAAALAEGIVYLGGGTPIQTACGFEDRLDDMFRYMMAACGPDPDEAKIARYCEESLGHFDWLVARGVPFDPTFYTETSMAQDVAVKEAPPAPPAGRSSQALLAVTGDLRPSSAAGRLHVAGTCRRGYPRTRRQSGPVCLPPR